MPTAAIRTGGLSWVGWGTHLSLSILMNPGV
jgi:hypothetical protein